MSPRPRYNPSGRTEVGRLINQLDALFVRVDDVDAASELSGDLNRYLCVRVSGFLEQALMSAGRACCSRMAGGPALAFAESWLERAPNPRADEVVRLVRRFDRRWATDLEELLAADERAGRINALLGIRNDIAHGKNQGVSRAQAWDYYELCREIVEWVLDRMDPLPSPAP